MCGLVAIYSQSDQALDVDVIEAMTHALRHRGPDDFGFAFVGSTTARSWREEATPLPPEAGVALGHRRLSILDLTAAGRQPFVSDDGRFWMVYNGEIYNYLELAEELRGLGHRFATRTDTEVLLAAYRQWGEDCFARLNGMWALVIWDAREHVLVACRDRFGEKPLYYSRLGSDWLFASEAKALLAHPGVTARPHAQAVAAFLADRTWPLPGQTFYEGISEVEPGSYVRLLDGVARTHRHWQLPSPAAPVVEDDATAVTRFLELLDDAVRLRLRSDVRVGTMLSGGLDSTSVIRAVVDQLGDGNLARGSVGSSVHAFTATFPAHHELDESDRVDEFCAEAPITVHEVFPLGEQDVERLFLDSTYDLEMPFTKSVPLVHTLLMRRARESGVTVVLNGHGSDELFAGYRGYVRLAGLDSLRRGRIGSAARHLIGLHRYHGYSWADLVRAAGGSSGVSRVVPGVTTANVVRPLAAADPPERPPQMYGHNELAGRSALDTALRRDFCQRVLPRWLHMEDRVSMAASVEARPPFLDHRLVEYAFSLADHLRIRGGHTKWVLRRAMANRLPPSITRTSPKFMFSGPDADWLAGPLRPVLETSLAGDDAMVHEYLDSATMRAAVADFLDGDRSMSTDLWRALSVETWMRRFFG
ncbi:MAG: asparagine synthase (glutamine-hydrolyzing) [Gaiellales bacterium]